MILFQNLHQVGWPEYIWICLLLLSQFFWSSVHPMLSLFHTCVTFSLVSRQYLGSPNFPGWLCGIPPGPHDLLSRRGAWESVFLSIQVILLSGKSEGKPCFVLGSQEPHLELELHSHPVPVFRCITLPSRLCESAGVCGRAWRRCWLEAVAGPSPSQAVASTRCLWFSVVRSRVSLLRIGGEGLPCTAPFASVWQDAEVGFEPQNSPALGLRIHCLTSLCLSFLSCKTRMGWDGWGLGVS